MTVTKAHKSANLSDLDASEQRRCDLVDDVAGTHRDAARGDRLAADELCGVSQESLEDRRAQTRPDQPGGDVLVGGVELVEVAYDFHSLNRSKRRDRRQEQAMRRDRP